MKAIKQLFQVVNEPVSSEEIDGLLSACNQKLPALYPKFLSKANGAESCLHDDGGDCLALWRAEEIIELNGAYEIPKYLPDLLVIGSDGGDDAIGFDRLGRENPDEWPVVRIGFGNLDRADFVQLADSFKEWWQSEFRLKR